MKQKLVYGAVLCAAIVTGVFYACKKENEGVPRMPATGVQGSSSARSFDGLNTFYSKTYGDTVYKMTIDRSASGEIYIDRSVYQTDRPDTFKVLQYIDPDINYTKVYIPNDTVHIDSIIVPPPTATSGRSHFYIPFQPGGQTVEQKGNHSGGDLVYDCVPMGACPANTMCTLIPNIFGGLAYFCWGCDHCWVTVNLPRDFPSGSKVILNGGGILIEGTKVHLEN